MRVYSAACGECAHEIQVPVLGMVQVGEAAVDQARG